MATSNVTINYCNTKLLISNPYIFIVLYNVKLREHDICVNPLFFQLVLLPNLPFSGFILLGGGGGGGGEEGLCRYNI